MTQYYKEKEKVMRFVRMKLADFDFDLSEGMNYNQFMKQLRVNSVLGEKAIKNILDNMIDFFECHVVEGFIIKKRGDD